MTDPFGYIKPKYEGEPLGEGRVVDTNVWVTELPQTTFPCPFCSLEVSSKEVISHLRKHICCGCDRCEERNGDK